MKETGRHYIKTKWCMLCTVLFIVITYGFALFLTSLGVTGFSLLHTMARFNFYLCFALVSVSYIFISRANQNDIKEVSDAIGGRAVYEKRAFLLVTIVTIFWNIGMCAILIVCSIQNDGTGYFLSWFAPNFFYNIFVPQIICILMTLLVAESANHIKWLMAECFFLFMISPFAEVFVWKRKPDIPLDQIWKVIRWPFQILYQNGEWSPDYQNDFQLEPVRIFLLFFWLFLLAGMAWVRIWKRKKSGVFLCALAAVCLLMSYQPASLYRLNSNWDGMNQDYTQYQIHTDDYDEQEDIKADFRVTEYDLKVALKNELSVDSTLTLESVRGSKNFIFTLYRGYHVNKVEALSENVGVTYKQKEDQLIVQSDHQVKKLKILISYKGHHNKFYANVKAAMLPGWFPWYPMAGTHPVVFEYSDYGRMWGYDPYNRVENAKIQMQTNKEICTNLTEQGNCNYEGVTDSITLLRGNIEKTENGQINDFLPLQLYKGYGVREFETQQKQNYENAIKNLKEIYGIDTSFLNGKKIIFASKDMGRNVTNDFFAVFDDYILATPDYIDENEILHYMILRDRSFEKRRAESDIMQIVIQSVLSGDPDEIVNSWITEAAEKMQNSQESKRNDDELRLFVDILKQADSGQMVKDAVWYVLQPESYENDSEFLKTMRKKYD